MPELGYSDTEEEDSFRENTNFLSCIILTKKSGIYKYASMASLA